jgi:hypothetical protein
MVNFGGWKSAPLADTEIPLANSSRVHATARVLHDKAHLVASDIRCFYGRFARFSRVRQPEVFLVTINLCDKPAFSRRAAKNSTCNLFIRRMQITDERIKAGFSVII